MLTLNVFKNLIALQHKLCKLICRHMFTVIHTLSKHLYLKTFTINRHCNKASIQRLARKSMFTKYLFLALIEPLFGFSGERLSVLWNVQKTNSISVC